MKSIFYIPKQPISFEKVTNLIQEEREKNFLINEVMAMSIVKSKYIGEKIKLDSILIGLYLIPLCICFTMINIRETSLLIFFLVLLFAFAILTVIYVRKNFNKNLDCKYSIFYLKGKLSQGNVQIQNPIQNNTKPKCSDEYINRLKESFMAVNNSNDKANDTHGLSSRAIAFCYFFFKFNNYKNGCFLLFAPLTSIITGQSTKQIYGKLTHDISLMKEFETEPTKQIKQSDYEKIIRYFNEAIKIFNEILESINRDRQNFINKFSIQ